MSDFSDPMACSMPGFLSFTIPQSLLKLMFTESGMPSNHLLCHICLLLSSIFASLRVFSSELALLPNGQSIEASTSAPVFPMNIRGQFPLGLIGLIFIHSNVLGKSSPEPKFKSNNYLVLSLFYCPTLTSVHDYWKNHSFDCTYLCWKRDVSTF